MEATREGTDEKLSTQTDKNGRFDVDRESLELALKGENSVYRYDVLPDRVILYMWPSAGGSEFTFQFRPRFAMQAETAPSLLYDYYNPDASVTVKPSRFEVTQGKEAKP